MALKTLHPWALGLALATVAAAVSIAQEQSSTAQSSTQPQPVAASGPALEEVVVTAERRAQNLQEAPISVTAVSGEELAKHDVTAISDLTQLVPALEAYQGVGPYSYLTVRGVSSLVVNAFGDPAVAVNLDQVYLARTTSFQGLFYDVQRVEVLKGPQGTLYGRNATGGAINVLTNSPTFDGFSSELTLQFGNYSDIRSTGYINVTCPSPRTSQCGAPFRRSITTAISTTARVTRTSSRAVSHSEWILRQTSR